MNYLAALTLSLLLSLSSWPNAEKFMDSVVPIKIGDTGSCTGFVINTEKHYILTAAHCDGADLYADNSPAKIVSKDSKADLLVLSVKDIDKPALKLALKNPLVGEEVASIGFGYGLEDPLFRVSHISNSKLQLPDEPGTFLAVDTSFVPGQSGGPVVNAAGEVVMIVQLASDRVGFGRGAEQIKAKVGKYFSK